MICSHEYNLIFVSKIFLTKVSSKHVLNEGHL